MTQFVHPWSRSLDSLRSSAIAMKVTEQQLIDSLSNLIDAGIINFYMSDGKPLLCLKETWQELQCKYARPKNRKRA